MKTIPIALAVTPKLKTRLKHTYILYTLGIHLTNNIPMN